MTWVTENNKWVWKEKIIAQQRTRTPVFSELLYRGVSSHTPVDPGIWGSGTYYTTSKSYARQYASPLPGGKLMEQWVDLYNPYIIPANAPLSWEGLWGKVLNWAKLASLIKGKGFAEQEKIQSKFIRDELENLGYDGIVIHLPTGEKEVVVFHPERLSDLITLLHKDIFSEKQAIQDYTDHIEKARAMGDESLAQLLEHILKEEKEHIKELADRLKR